MITRDIDKELFKIFAQNSCDDVELLNSVIWKVYELVEKEVGRADAEVYDFIVDLQNSENNTGWESRHEERIDKLYEIGAIIEQRSGDYLP